MQMSLRQSNYNIPRNDTFARGFPLSSRGRSRRELLPITPEQTSVSVTVTFTETSKTETSTTKQPGVKMDSPQYTDSPFLKLFARIESIGNLQDDWNSYGAAAPNTKARFWARRVLDELVGLNFAPLTVSASSDEGVAIFFRSENKRASIECLNSGEILGVLSEGLKAPEVVAISQDRLKQAVGTIRTFLTT